MTAERSRPRAAEVPPFDLLIVGGTVVNGSASAAPWRADVGIVADRITALGDLGGASARSKLVVDGSIVAPGFIDPHTHVETALLADGADALAPVLQGVTTCLSAPDGFGWAPLTQSAARELWKATAGIHDPWPPDLRTETIDAYFAGFENRIALNVLPQIPLMAVRFAVMGWDPAPATGNQLARMRGLASEWLALGATGLSVGLDYEPSARVKEDELAELCSVVARSGGTLSAHLRYQDAGRAAAWLEMANINRRTGISITIAHEILDDEGVELLARLRRDADISIETYLYPASSTHLTMFVSKADRAGGPVAVAERLREPRQLERIRADLQRALEAELAAGERIVFAASARPARVGRDLADLAIEDHVDLGDAAVGVLRDDPDALFVFRHRVTQESREAAARTISSPVTIVASDGIYRAGQMHPRGYGTFPRILRVAVREWGAVDLAGAIHAMTGRTAHRYRVPERGFVEVGRFADLVIFNPDTVSDRATWLEPRLTPTGIDHVIVGGQFAVRNGRPTGVRSGRVLAAA